MVDLLGVPVAVAVHTGPADPQMMISEAVAPVGASQADVVPMMTF